MCRIKEEEENSMRRKTRGSRVGTALYKQDEDEEQQQEKQGVYLAGWQL